ncbi:hypothetical protein ACFW7J_27600 [Streptomyces sp. NPDC059525]|uniref:hypothetical protein n=1 Tax=Streptomyces sp. NPDC059525 TaxID=3346857 RepID=UPI00369A358A
MADDVQQQEDDQNLWRAVFTADRGWGEGTAFADHLSVAAPALAEANGTLYCAHRGARQGKQKQLPLRWTSFTPAVLEPLVDALEQARVPLPEDATDAEQQKWQEAVTAAAEALDKARKWAPDDYVDWVVSAETPALVNDNGTVRMVFTRVEWMDDDGSQYSDQKIRATSLWETWLKDVDGEPGWAKPRQIPVHSGLPMAPGLAVFNGAVHLVFVDPHDEYAQHLVRDAEGQWTSRVTPEALSAYKKAYAERKALVARDDDEANKALRDLEVPTLPLPFRGDTLDWYNEAEFDKYGWPGNAALAVHDGKLHLLLRESPMAGYVSEDGTDVQGGGLLHAVFDGTTWDSGTCIPDDSDKMGRVLSASRRGAALASFDGKIHAVYPAMFGDKLIHTTWTSDGGWTLPTEVEGHDSNNTPALLSFKDGPAGVEREALLLVHRGVDRYVPPTPPAPPTLKDVAERGTPVTGKLLTAYGARDWSRLEHQFTLTPATMNNGEQGLIVTFEAWGQYRSRLGWWSRENYGGSYKPRLKVDLYLREAPRLGAVVGHAQFAETADNGYWRFEKVFTGVKAGGEYKAGLFTDNTEKTGGYWWNAPASLEDSSVKRNSEQYTRVSNFRSSSAEITLPK